MKADYPPLNSTVGIEQPVRFVIISTLKRKLEMPIPKRKEGESKTKFLSRCMENPTMNKDYPDQSQRYAVCIGQSKSSLLENSAFFIKDLSSRL